MDDFFSGFTFDTLISIISCVIGAIALIIGSVAYNNCKINKPIIKQKKKFKDNGTDNSQNAGGNIINNGLNGTELESITETFVSITNSNFSQAMDSAYKMFQQQCDNNLEKIMRKTDEIIRDNKYQIAGYSKIDWIHIYFESAKNTSDEYMQNIWAKLLAKELETPDSFSYKTLNVLKNMTSEDFRRFERMCSLITDQFVFSEKEYDEFGISYYDLIKLSEHGLLNMELSQKTVDLNTNEIHAVLCNEYVIIIQNLTATPINIHYSGYIVTTAAIELNQLVDKTVELNYARKIVSELFKKNSKATVSLYRIKSIVNGRVDYEKENLA